MQTCIILNYVQADKLPIMIIQNKTSIYKCRNLRGNLGCNLFSEIIQISHTQCLNDAAAQRKTRPAA